MLAVFLAFGPLWLHDRIGRQRSTTVLAGAQRSDGTTQAKEGKPGPQ
jgi:hypothetical protein